MDLIDPNIFRSEYLLPEIMQQRRTAEVGYADPQALTLTEKQDLENQTERDSLNAWAVFQRAYDEQYRTHVDGYVEAIADLRNITDASDEFTLTMGARMQGFQLDQAYFKRIAVPTLTKMLPVFPQYAEWNQGERWYDFLSMLLDGKVTAKPLYTEDYVNFDVSPGGPLLHAGGTWFKTTHVQVSLSYMGYNNVLTSLEQPFSTEPALQMLDAYMPLNLVLKHLGFYVGFEIKVGVGCHWLTSRQRARFRAEIHDPKLAQWGRIIKGRAL